MFMLFLLPWKLIFHKKSLIPMYQTHIALMVPTAGLEPATY